MKKNEENEKKNEEKSNKKAYFLCCQINVEISSDWKVCKKKKKRILNK